MLNWTLLRLTRLHYFFFTILTQAILKYILMGLDNCNLSLTVLNKRIVFTARYYNTVNNNFLHRLHTHDIYLRAIYNTVLLLIIHTWSLQTFSQSYDLAFDKTNAVCVNFISVGRNLQFNINSEEKVFVKIFSWQIYLISEFLSEIGWEEIAEEIFSYYRFDAWSGIQTRALRLISQHTAY